MLSLIASEFTIVWGDGEEYVEPYEHSNVGKVCREEKAYRGDWND